jgi:hypothetical protein
VPICLPMHGGDVRRTEGWYRVLVPHFALPVIVDMPIVEKKTQKKDNGNHVHRRSIYVAIQWEASRYISI